MTEKKIVSPAEYYDAVADQYDRAFSDPTSRWENARVKRMLRRYHNMLTLDLGCGTGLALDLIEPQSYIGIDISPHMIGVARSRNGKANISFSVGDMEHLPRGIAPELVISLFGSPSYALQPSLQWLWRVLAPWTHVFLMFYAGGNDGLVYRADRAAYPGNEALYPAWHWTEAGLREAIREVDGDFRIQGFSYRLMPGRLPSRASLLWGRIMETVSPGECNYLILRGCYRGRSD